MLPLFSRALPLKNLKFTTKTQKPFIHFVQSKTDFSIPIRKSYTAARRQHHTALRRGTYHRQKLTVFYHTNVNLTQVNFESLWNELCTDWIMFLRSREFVSIRRSAESSFVFIVIQFYAWPNILQDKFKQHTSIVRLRHFWQRVFSRLISLAGIGWCWNA